MLQTLNSNRWNIKIWKFKTKALLKKRGTSLRTRTTEKRHFKLDDAVGLWVSRTRSRQRQWGAFLPWWDRECHVRSPQARDWVGLPHSRTRGIKYVSASRDEAYTKLLSSAGSGTGFPGQWQGQWHSQIMTAQIPELTLGDLVQNWGRGWGGG